MPNLPYADVRPVSYTHLASDIEITAREIQKLKKELYTIIADHSHTDFDKVWADSDRDYLSLIHIL